MRLYHTLQGSLFFSVIKWLVVLTFVIVLVIGIVIASFYVKETSKVVKQQFEGRKWALPARVYARALEIYPGMELSIENIVAELELMRYRLEDNPTKPGSYHVNDNSITIVSRAFQFIKEQEPSRHITLTFKKNILTKILSDNQEVFLLRLDPVLIGSFYPQHGEDRVLVKYEQIPKQLIQTLTAVEDNEFYNHFGIDIKGILRAIISNLKAGKTVQGGSTLTQQLVKNYFLTDERSLKRKIKEAVMAMVLEYYYDKEQILEAYFNEIHLGQEGNRAIHGFGLASQFYFNRTIEELELHHMALLVALVKGASYYNPRRYPERALERRNLVLDLMVTHGVIDQIVADNTKALPLDVLPDAPKGSSRFPAYFDLVKRQLYQDYKKEDLHSQGLRIFTYLDPEIQLTTEKAIAKKLPEIEKTKGLEENTLETAAIIARSETGEIVALQGGREAEYAGFNRTLDAKRLIGSLIKPVIYITALQYSYHLASIIQDTEYEVPISKNNTWKPKNYDGKYHGDVLLYKALAKSYNIPAVKTGLMLNLEVVIASLLKLGIDQKDIPPYPSLLLGTVQITPFEVAQIYQTFAASGFQSPLRAIEAVVTEDNQILKRNSLKIKEIFDTDSTLLLNTALQKVVSEGTAIYLTSIINNKKYQLAGKTGTTNDLIDSWFAGFSGNFVTVVWVGRDDNKNAKVTGSSGALRIWGEIMKDVPLQPLTPTPSENIIYTWIDGQNGLLSKPGCPNSLVLPFKTTYIPKTKSPNCN